VALSRPPPRARNLQRIGETMRMLGETWSLLRATFDEWQEDEASRLAASLAFYSALSMAPLVLFAVAIAGLVFGAEAARGQITSEIGGVIGHPGAEAIESILSSAHNKAQGTAATLIGVGVLLFGASGVFSELQTAMNTIWEVRARPGRGVWGTIKDRFASFTMVVGVGFLLMVSLILSAGLSAMTELFHLDDATPFLVQGVHILFSIATTSALFALLFKVVPDARVRWNDVWVGATVTAIMFTLGKLLIGLYLGRSSVASAYGAAGSIMAVLVWVYYSAQILFFGAELTQVWATRHGCVIVPSANAIPIARANAAKATASSSHTAQTNPPARAD
jgi:membrane protein